MAIDLNPAVGRILVGRGRSTEFFPWYEKAGKITKISGQRVYYADPESGKEKFLHEYSAVVDTPDEEKALLDFTTQGKKRVADLRKVMDAESEALLAKFAEPVLKSISQRRTRSRG